MGNSVFREESELRRNEPSSLKDHIKETVFRSWYTEENNVPFLNYIVYIDLIQKI